MTRWRDPAERAVLQRRTLHVLVGAQLVAAVGVSGAAAGALLEFDITGSESLASLPLALIVVGSSAGVMPISALSRRAGRRVGLTSALATAAVGAVGIVAAGTLGSFALLRGSTKPRSTDEIAPRCGQTRKTTTRERTDP